MFLGRGFSWIDSVAQLKGIVRSSAHNMESLSAPSFPASAVTFNPRGRRELLGVKTWLSTLEIVNLSVFRMRQ